MFPDKPFCQPCENNKHAILEQLQYAFKDCESVLEIGSGTGQHAVFFAQNLTHLVWQTSDRIENHEGINHWIDDYPSPNLKRPIELDVTSSASAWPAHIDGVFTANTCHIMPWGVVESMFKGVSHALKPKGIFAIYGPFCYNQQFTSEGNERFDQHLKASNPEQGIRDFEAINSLAEFVGLTLLDDITMPANNRFLMLQKS